MTLDVVVTDQSGKPVSGLQQQDFTLLDNKQPSKIVSFHAVEGGAATPDPPVEIILLVDEINTTISKLAFERNEMEKFLRQNDAELARPASMVFLSDSGVMVGNTSTRDGNAIIADLEQKKFGLRTIGRSQGLYGAGDRFHLSFHTLERLADYEAAKPGRKLMVWISPGWPLLSTPDVVMNPKQRQGLFNSIVGISDRLRRARMTLYAVDPLGTDDEDRMRTYVYENFLKPVRKAGQVEPGNLALQVLAAQSGGRVLYANNDVAGEIEACVADANTFYVLSFDGLPGDGPNEYHALEIKIDKPGLKARTRSGYYAQP
jgi:VWFA-related protein